MSEISPPVDLTDKDAVLAYVVASFEKYPAFGLDGEYCQYRNSQGVGCAFGRLIPDALYDTVTDDNTGRTIGSECEGTIASDAIAIIVGRTGLEESPWYLAGDAVSQHYGFLDQLQAIHDAHARQEKAIVDMLGAYHSWKSHGYPVIDLAPPRTQTDVSIVAREWEQA